MFLSDYTMQLAARILIGVVNRFYDAMLQVEDLGEGPVDAAWRLLSYFDLDTVERAVAAVKQLNHVPAVGDDVQRGLAIYNAGRPAGLPARSIRNLVLDATRLVTEVPRDELFGIGAIQDTAPEYIERFAENVRPASATR